MTTSGKHDRWSSLACDQEIEDAAERLQQMAGTHSEQIAMQQWVRTLAPESGERLLDAGAGTGCMSLAFARQMAPEGEVHALDLAPGLLAYAEQEARAEGLYERLHLHAADVRELPFSTGVFDAVFCRWVLLHLPDPEKALAELCRAARPGGRILCVEVDWATLDVEPGERDITRQIVRANVERQVDGRSGHRLPALLRSAGLEDIQVIPMNARDTQGDWLPFLESRLTVAAAAGVSRAALQRWWQEIQTAVKQGDYHFSFTQYGVLGTRP